MLRLSRYTINRYCLVVSPFLVAFFALLPLFGVGIPPGILAVLAVLSLWPVSELALPPGVLFLGSSSERSGELLSSIQSTAFPLRTVALLDPGRINDGGRRSFRFALMRTKDETTWKSMVLRLADLAHVLIIDTVHRTAPIRYETEFVLTPECAVRTIFVSAQDGTCPSLEEVGIVPAKYGIPVTDPVHINEAWGRLIVKLDARPRRQPRMALQGTSLVPETFATMSSVLVIIFDRTLDGRYLLAQANRSDKELIAILPPDLEGANVFRFMERAWEFARVPQLVGIYSESLLAAMVRRDFLRADRSLSELHVTQPAMKDMTWEQLNGPNLLGLALLELTTRWRAEAAAVGQEFRLMC